MPSLFDYEITSYYLRSVTDEDAEAQLHHPTVWSYAARDPTGLIFSSGRKTTRKECERVAIVHAAEHVEEAWPESKRWPADGWRFLIWPLIGPADGGAQSNSLSLSMLDAENSETAMAVNVAWDADAVCAPEAMGIEMRAKYPDDFEKNGVHDGRLRIGPAEQLGAQHSGSLPCDRREPAAQNGLSSARLVGRLAMDARWREGRLDHTARRA